MLAIIRPLVADRTDVSVKFTECENQCAQDGLNSGEFDVIVCVANAMKPGITYETLLDVSPYVLVSQAHVFAARANIAMQDLSDESLFLLNLPNISEYDATQFEDAGIVANIVATVTPLEMVRSLSSRSVYCSIVHMVTANDKIYAGDKVIVVPLLPPVEPFRTVVGHLPDNQRRLVKVFVDELRTFFHLPQADHCM